MKTIKNLVFAGLISSLCACSSVSDLPEEPAVPSAGLERSIADGDTERPKDDALDVPIKWYALDNENSEHYWENVDCSQVWIEFPTNLQLADDEVASFLRSQALNNITRKSPNPDRTNYYVFALPDGNKEKVLQVVRAAFDTGFILFAEPLTRYTRNFTPNDALYEFQWGHYVVDSEVAWNTVTGGSLNVIAVIDDAVDYTHEDLTDQVWYGWDYGFNDNDPFPDVDDQIHGTHVTGIIAASINNGLGVAGMINDTIYFAKVTDANYDPAFGNFSDAAIVDALFDIAEIDRIGTVNMSLGGPTPSAALEQACAAAANAGKLLIAASGNDGTGLISFPAAFASCMAVGSVGTDGYDLYLAPYSQFGAEQEVVAPGGDSETGFGILSTVPGNDYAALQGTSMATPFTAGLAGMIQAVNPNLSSGQVRNIIQQTCLDLGPVGYDNTFGHGLINASAAVALALNDFPDSVGEESSLEMAVYPNPVVDFLSLSRTENEAPLWVGLRSIEGKLLLQNNMEAGTSDLRLDLNSLPAGSYLLEIRALAGPQKDILLHSQLIIKP